jgi:predicted AAA+ superfamily ATPase
MESKSTAVVDAESTGFLQAHKQLLSGVDGVIHGMYNSVMAPSEEVQQVLREINSYWRTPHEVRPIPPPYERRHVASLLESIDRAGAKAQVLRGPRQVGKSTAILQVIRRLLGQGVPSKDMLLVRFDLDILRERSSLLEILRWHAGEIRGADLQADPAMYLFLDEVHKLPRWDAQIKHVFDTYRPRMILTGSSSVLVARGQRESLAGRTLTTEIPPFLFREILELGSGSKDTALPGTIDWREIFEQGLGIRERWEAIVRQPAQRRHSWKRLLDRYYNRGGYPDLHTGAVEDDRWADYLMETVFERVLGLDIPDLFPVDQPRLLRHLYMEVARRTGQEIAQKKLADEATAAGYATNQPTVGRYLHYLTDALLIREFRRYPLARKSSAKLPVKYTLTDLGVRNAIFRGAPSLWESAPDVVGPLVETLVQTVLRGTGLQTHFYRQPRDPARPRNGFDEVDFVLEAPDGAVVPIEVKYRHRVDHSDLEAVHRFVERYRSPLGIVVTRETYRVDEGRRIILVPLMEFLLSF